MAKHDAFGREVGEDPLKALRGDGTPATETTRVDPEVAVGSVGTRGAYEPLGAPVEVVRKLEAEARRHTAPSLPAGWVLRLVLSLFVLVPVGIAGVAVYGALEDTEDVIDGVRESIERGVGEGPVVAPGDGDGGGAGEERPPGPASGLQRGSLITRAELAPALTRMREAGHGRLRLLRVAPDRLNAQTVTGKGALRNVNVGPDGPPELISESPGVGRGMATIPYASIDARAPFRLTRSAAGRLRVPTTRVDYLVLLATPGQPARWLVYFKDGKGAFEGDGRGRVVRRIS